MPRLCASRLPALLLTLGCVIARRGALASRHGVTDRGRLTGQSAHDAAGLQATIGSSRHGDAIGKAVPTFSSLELATMDEALTLCEGRHQSNCPDDGSFSFEGRLANQPTERQMAICRKLWIRLLAAGPAQEWPPPKTVPADKMQAFTMNGKARIESLYFEQRYSGKQALVNAWDKKDLGRRIATPDPKSATAGIDSYTPDTSVYVDRVLTNHSSSIRDKVGLVWGSERPWLEVLLARHRARLTLTVEYGDVDSTHPTIAATTPQQFGAYMLQNDRQFDFAFTYSSLEHSGLGRYGDVLNPVGDLEAAAQTWCALKPGGILFLGVPSVDASSSSDVLVWNAHRFYGPHRLAKMFAGFEHVHSYRDAPNPGESIVHVLRKLE
jgi:hypothetical protein